MRRKRAARRKIEPDPVHEDQLLARLINRVMKRGEKTLARGLVYKALDRIKEQGLDPMKTFNQAVNNVRPSVEVRPRRVGGAAYHVPMPVKGDRQVSLAIRWLVLGARARPNSEYHTFDQKLAAELIDAAQGTGRAVKRKEEVFKIAEANKAFAHFRW
jgi:small subunit ribosomal protein S7